MTNDEFGDYLKTFETSYESVAMRGLPLLARLDGRAFHTYTRGLERPYSSALSKCMQEVTKHLVEKTHALVGYTQSDEITLAWYHSTDSGIEYDFGGRIQKLTSVLAGVASAQFAVLAQEHLPQKKHLLPTFDCRVFQVPDLKVAADVFVWREDDATKNSVTMAASAYYSHKQLHGKNSADKHDLLHAIGINWNDYPAHFKRGVYFRRRAIEKTLTVEETARIPEKYRPADGVVVRHEIVDVEMPPIRRVEDRVNALFGTSS